jgi:hypothetical protein
VKCSGREEDLDIDFLEEKRGSVKALKANPSPTREKALISSRQLYAHPVNLMTLFNRADIAHPLKNPKQQ